MITTRPLLADWFTASWIESNRQSLKSLRFRSIRARPSAALIFWGPSVGRNTYPVDTALSIDCCARFTESGWQTTRAVVSERADAGERAVGTSPPAHGCTEQSGAGSGQ